MLQLYRHTTLAIESHLQMFQTWIRLKLRAQPAHVTLIYIRYPSSSSSSICKPNYTSEQFYLQATDNSYLPEIQTLQLHRKETEIFFQTYHCHRLKHRWQEC